MPISQKSYTSAAPEQVQDDVLFKPNRGIRVIELNRPAKLNSLNQSMVDKITPRLAEWTKSDVAQTVVLKGNGKALCAGGDVAALALAIKNEGEQGSAQSTTFFKDEYTLNHLIAAYPKPYISIMDGIVMGGGVGLSVHAPFRVVTEKTMFAMPETDIGFFPDVGGSFFLSRLDGEIGTYLALTSSRLKGYDVVSAGIGTHYIPQSQLESLEARLAEIFVDGKVYSQDAFDLVNNVLNEFSADAPEGFQFSLSGANRELIDRAFSKSTIEAIVAELESDGSELAKSALKAINTRSPTSVKVTLAALRQGKTLGIKDALNAEYRIAENFMYGHEFAEGVIAKLIEKREPKWEPASFEGVGSSLVAQYLTPRASSESENITFHYPDVNYLQYPHKYGLPTEQQVQDYITGNDSIDREFKVTTDEVFEHFDNITKSKLGIKAKIQDILERKTTPDPTEATLLDWKYE